VKHALVKLLQCPQHGVSLALEVREEVEGEIKTGSLSCVAGHAYPIVKFIPRFAETDEYARTFSAQRNYVRRHFRAYMSDRSGYDLFPMSTGLSRADVARSLSLEVGCGYGRFVDVAQQFGGEVVGIDLSTQSIELAHSYVGMRPGVHLVQADLFRLPLKKALFSNVYSIGVLHHTPDCRRAFEAVVPYVADGGKISIWVYHPTNQENALSWRRLTTRWSSSTLYAWCIFNQIAFGWIRRIPWIRWKFDKLVPGTAPGRGRQFWLRVMEDFDNLSPVYASSHSEEEVLRWFVEAGLVNVRRLPRATSVTGWRPPTNGRRAGAEQSAESRLTESLHHSHGRRTSA